MGFLFRWQGISKVVQAACAVSSLPCAEITFAARVSWLSVITLAFETMLSKSLGFVFLKSKYLVFVKLCLEAHWFNCLLKEALPGGSVCGHTLASLQALGLFFHLSFCAVIGMGPRVLTGPSVVSHWAIAQPGPSFLLLLCSWTLRWPSEGQQHDLARTSQKTDTSERFQRPLSMPCQFCHSEPQCHCIQQAFGGHSGQVKVRGLGFQTSSLGPFFAYVYLHV